MAARISIAGMLVAALVVVTGVRAQDGPELEQRVEALETRVAALESTPLAVRAVGADNVLTFSGTGDAISEPFTLPDTNIILTVEGADHTYVVLYPWPGSANIGQATSRGPATSHVIWARASSGQYVLSVVATTDWSVTIEYP